jgi:hypothetical protein
MKKSKWTIRLIAIAAFAASLVLVQSCKDDEPPALSLVSLTANGIDLNALLEISANVPPPARFLISAILEIFILTGAISFTSLNICSLLFPAQLPEILFYKTLIIKP